ncbi:Cna B-type domain-containing protein [Candidatus Saccharibacteria bacterium]|nr:Cna B-type domain-containing protein [Candidatus Saccharibacteria bacterium]
MVGILPANLVSAAQQKPTTFNHIDIRSAASFTYNVDGISQVVNINFHQNTGQLNNIKLFRRNLNGTTTNIPVNGSWRQDGGEWEYSVKGKFDRYYSDNHIVQNEVKYFAEFTLNVNIAGNNETLVFVGDDYSYSSSNNVCPGSETLGTKGIDMRIKGEDLTNYFSQTTVMVEKKWEGATVLPDSVTVALLRDDESTGETMNLTAERGWKGIFSGLQKIDPVDGHEYTYSVVETAIDGVALTNGELIIRSAANGALVGKWSALARGLVVTNTWTPAKEIYENSGTTGFRIRKVDEAGEILDGAEFALMSGGELVEAAVLENGEYEFGNLEAGTYQLKETKAPVDYVLPIEPIVVTITRSKKFVSADTSTLTNTYRYEFVVAFSNTENAYYENGILNVKNTLKQTSVTARKIWADNKTAQSVTVQLYKDGQAVDGKTAELSEANNWTYVWNGLRETVNGKTIAYEVKETAVFGATMVGNGFVVYGAEQTATGETEVEGQWSATEAGNCGGKVWTVTNSWTAASSEFIGTPKFYIQKVDQNGKPLKISGIKFVMTGNNGFERELVTDAEGRIEISNLPTNVNVWNDEHAYKIIETETAHGYGLAEGFAEIKITSGKGQLAGVNGLVNTFEKVFTFTVEGSDDYSWDAMNNTFVVTNRVVDPCAVYGGCGGGGTDIEELPKAPDTGFNMAKISGNNTVVDSTSYAMVGNMFALIVLAGAVRLTRRK